MNISTIFNLFICDSILSSVDEHDFKKLYFLLEHYKPINSCAYESSYKTLRQLILSLKHKYIIKSIIKRSNIQLGISNRETMLHLAVRNNDICVIKFLIDKGLDLNIKASLIIENRIFHEVTPLHIGAFYGYKEAISLLITAGADLNAGCYKVIEPDTMREGQLGNEITIFNITPLHLAAINGRIDTINLLLEKNAVFNNFSIVDGKKILEHGNMLHLAAIKGRREVVDLVIKEKFLT